MWSQCESLKVITLPLLPLCSSFSGGVPNNRRLQPTTPRSCSRAPAAAAAGHSSAAPEDRVKSVGNVDPAAVLESAVSQTVPEQQLEDALAACRIHRYGNVYKVWGVWTQILLMAQHRRSRSSSFTMSSPHVGSTSMQMCWGSVVRC